MDDLMRYLVIRQNFFDYLQFLNLNFLSLEIIHVLKLFPHNNQALGQVKHWFCYPTKMQYAAKTAEFPDPSHHQVMQTKILLWQFYLR